jgi:P27 family predicted phage terminase small subunit
MPGRKPNLPTDGPPSTAAEIPDPPEHLDEVAAAEFVRTAAELATVGLVEQVDRAALAAYCQAWSRWVAAEIAVGEMGLVVKSPTGFPIANPYLSIANKALSQIKAFAVEFGFTPAARVRVAQMMDAPDEPQEEPAP